MTQHQRIALALADACGDDIESRFTESDVAMIAWRRFPDVFGMAKHTEHPDTKKMSSLLMAKRTWIAEPWVVRVAPGRYSLTVAGVDEARRLRNGSA